MARVETQNLTGAPLDWAVAKCEGVSLEHGLTDDERYSTDWSQGGPIIGRAQISLDQFKGHPCRAYLGTHVHYEHAMFAPEGQPLTAAMRCYVSSKLGDEVDVPDELLQTA